MSQGSSNPTLPSRPVMASEQQETLTPVSHVFGLSEVSASLEALNIEVERKPTVVHHVQASYSPGASMTPWSPNARDHRRSTQASTLKLKRYALQIWLEIEVGPGYFLPPEDDSYSTDFALEVLNRTYLGCTGVYLDRGGHMLAFYGRKGSSKADEAAINFLIWVGTSVSNLAKDWKDELTECELRALQNEVSLNGVKEEIRHVLDSEMAKRNGHLTPQQMYEAIKKYETYVARNRRLDGKGASTSASPQKATGQSSGYKP